MPCSSSSLTGVGHRVEREGVRPGGELLVREVDPGVDHRQRHSRSRRRPAVGADVRDPPFRGREWVGVTEEPGGAAGLRSDRNVRSDRADEPAPQEPREHALRAPAREPPERERRGDQLAAGPSQRRGRRRATNAVELDERPRVGLEALERSKARRPGRHDGASLVCERGGLGRRAANDKGDGGEQEVAHRTERYRRQGRWSGDDR